uniref:Uncharacterized protein n=1 Tax=Micrurus spixii TaxID=129469 RepID=A0A2D4LWK1_9SAUR
MEKPKSIELKTTTPLDRIKGTLSERNKKITLLDKIRTERGNHCTTNQITNIYKSKPQVLKHCKKYKNICTHRVRRPADPEAIAVPGPLDSKIKPPFRVACLPGFFPPPAMIAHPGWRERTREELFFPTGQ